MSALKSSPISWDGVPRKDELRTLEYSSRLLVYNLYLGSIQNQRSFPISLYLFIYNLAPPQIKIILGFFVYCHKVLLGQKPLLLRHPKRTIRCCYPLSRGQEEKGVRREIAQQHGLSSWAEGTWVEHHSETEIKPSRPLSLAHARALPDIPCRKNGPDQVLRSTMLWPNQETEQLSSWLSFHTPQSLAGTGAPTSPFLLFLETEVSSLQLGGWIWAAAGLPAVPRVLVLFLLSNESAYEVTNSSLIIGSMLDALPIYVYFLRTRLLYFSFFSSSLHIKI